MMHSGKDLPSDEPSGQERLRHAQELFRSGDYDRAEAATKALLQIPALRADAYFGLGMISAKRNLTDAARGYFKNSLDLAPNSADAHFQLASLLHDTRRDEAEEHYRKALEARPGFGAARDGLRRLTDGSDVAPDHPGFGPAIDSDHAGRQPSEASAGRDSRYWKRVLAIIGKVLAVAVISALLGGVIFVVVASLPHRIGGFRLPRIGDEETFFATVVVATLAFVIGVRQIFGRPQTQTDPFIEMVESDRDPLSAKIAGLLKSVALDRRPALLAFPGRIFVMPAVLGLCTFVLLRMLPSRIGDIRLPRIGELEALWLAGGLAAVPALFGLIFVLTTRVSIRQGRVRIARGVLFRRVSYVELARVTDVIVRRGPWGLLTGYATLTLIIGAQAPRTIELNGLARGSRLSELAENIRQTAIALRASRWGRDVLVWR